MVCRPYIQSLFIVAIYIYICLYLYLPYIYIYTFIYKKYKYTFIYIYTKIYEVLRIHHFIQGHIFPRSSFRGIVTPSIKRQTVKLGVKIPVWSIPKILVLEVRPCPPSLPADIWVKPSKRNGIRQCLAVVDVSPPASDVE